MEGERQLCLLSADMFVSLQAAARTENTSKLIRLYLLSDTYLYMAMEEPLREGGVCLFLAARLLSNTVAANASAHVGRKRLTHADKYTHVHTHTHTHTHRCCLTSQVGPDPRSLSFSSLFNYQS